MAPDEHKQALLDAAALLAASPLSEAELKARLARKGHGQEAVERAVEHLKSLGCMDDAQIVQRTVEKAAAKKKGRLHVEAVLDRKGILERPEEDNEGEKRLARQLLDERLKPGDGARKAARLLAGQGFSEDAAWAVLSERFPEEMG